MKKAKIFLYIALTLTIAGLQSCLDFDTPSDEFEKNTVVVPPVIVKGEADKLIYTKEFTEDEFNTAMEHLQIPVDRFYSALTGIYAMRGGKQGGMPEAHSYQYQYSLGPDNYAQFSTVPHSDFMYGTLKSSYAVSKEFNGGPNGCYSIIKNSIVPLLNNGSIDTIPEMKALYLLMYNYASIEIADIYGPMPYTNYKNNVEKSPFEYEALRDIYYAAEANIDSIVNCLKHYGTRPQWYREVVQNTLYASMPLTIYDYSGTEGMEQWIRFANSLKLRMAVHISKVEPATAKKWAEEAVKAGVIEETKHEVALYINNLGVDHPLSRISEWGDTRMSASFESLLMSLDHPYVHYLFAKNSDPITNVGKNPNSSAPETTPKETRIIGMREGTVPGQGQSVGTNDYIAFSSVNKSVLADCKPPLYLMKLSEVNFLRAEGALRGWDMGGSAEQFYNDGIRYAGLEDRSVEEEFRRYDKLYQKYMERTTPVDYTYVDPTGNTPDMKSVTKIGVKWDESLSNEEKLEMIITQKYIASFPYSYEPWVDLRRTGYPKLFPVLNPGDGDGSLKDGDIIRRMPWASDDPQTVEDLNSTGIPALGGPDLQSTHLWWDVNAPNFQPE